MSSSSTTSTKRASSSRTATRSTSTHNSSSLTQSLSESLTSSYSASTPTQTATITDSASASATSSAVADSTSGSSTPVAAIVVVVIVVLGLISSGVIFFLCKRKRRKQRSVEESHVVNHEPKRRESHLQPALPDDVLLRSSKAEDDYDSDTKSPVHSIDSGLDVTSRAKPRSSRASSSIFNPDDNMTIASRSNFLRPVSLGEPIALKSIQLAAGQMPTLPESPLQPNTNMEQRSGSHPQTVSESSGSSEGDEDDKKSVHTFTVTRPDTPEPAPPLPPTPAQLPPLPLVPPIRTSLFNGSSRRDSSNTLAPTLRFDQSSRPQSMASVYSTQTQRLEGDDSLSPDVAEVLNRLKKRISTPWSINSITTARTERMSVTRASEEA